MENNREILAKLEKHARQQLLFTKLLCILCVLVVVCAVVLMLAVTEAAEGILELAQPLRSLTGQVQDLALEAETVMEDLGVVAEALAAADLDSIVEKINMLAADSQSAVADAIKKLDTIDIATLNKAIQDLADVVEPLAKVTKILG